jgi:hypothetical protein
VSQIGPFGMTKAQHDAAVAKRGRPLSDDPMHLHDVAPDSGADAMTLVDAYVAEHNRRKKKDKT